MRTVAAEFSPFLRIFRRMAWLLPVLMTAACAGTKPVGNMGVTVTDEEAVAFAPADSAPQLPAFMLGPGDEIEMVFLFDRSLDNRLIVRPDGGINLPIVGDVVVAGQSPGDLAKRIAAAYGRYYTNPQVAINLTKLAPPQCYVLGSVHSPKAVEIRPGMTVLGAIAQAGGPADFGNLKRTVLIRRVGNNQAVARKIDLASFMKGNAVSSDLYLQDFDIIYLPPTKLGRIVTFVDQVFSKMAYAPMLYLRGWEAFHTDRVYSSIFRPSSTNARTASDAEIPTEKP